MKTRLCSIFLLLFCHLAYGDDKLSGKLNILVDFNDSPTLPSYIYIHNTGLYYNADLIDTVKVTEKQFTYTAHLAEPSRVKISLAWPNKRVLATTFWAFPASYDLKSENMKPLISGGKGLNAGKLLAFEQALRNYQLRGDSLARAVDFRGQSIEEAKKEVGRIRDSMERSKYEFEYQRANDRDGVTSLFALIQYADLLLYRQRSKSQNDSIVTVLNSFDPEINALPAALKLRQRMEYSLSLLPGGSISDIELRDTIGKTVRISDYKGKYLLMEFWASWCVPCRDEAPALIELYQKHKSSNFEVISISRDDLSMKKAWLNAIKIDKTGILTQVSDFDNKAAELYDIQFVPANFLLDPKGKIIGKNMKVAELSSILANLLEP